MPWASFPASQRFASRLLFISLHHLRDHKPGSVLSVRIPPPSKVMQEQGALLPPAAPAMEELEPLPRVSLSALPTG
ncbi:DCP5 [Symbiodinium sp. CCMP2592]|nr:DCP5 [Symbiodinium sp. CCMP2592]